MTGADPDQMAGVEPAVGVADADEPLGMEGALPHLPLGAAAAEPRDGKAESEELRGAHQV